MRHVFLWQVWVIFYRFKMFHLKKTFDSSIGEKASENQVACLAKKIQEVCYVICVYFLDCRKH